jgi:hypothetical protein
LNLQAGTARIARSFTDGKYLSPTKTRRGRYDRDIHIPWNEQEARRRNDLSH